MTTTTRETAITAADDLPVVHIVREFDAPPAAVFRAHTDPDLFARWIGPAYLTTEVDRWDCRSGGEYRWRSVDGGETYAFRGCFHEVRPDELIVQTFNYEGFPDSVALERLVLEPLDGGRTRLHVASQFGSFEERDAMIASGMEVGVVEGYAALDALLSELEG